MSGLEVEIAVDGLQAAVQLTDHRRGPRSNSEFPGSGRQSAGNVALPWRVEGLANWAEPAGNR